MHKLTAIIIIFILASLAIGDYVLGIGILKSSGTLIKDIVFFYDPAKSPSACKRNGGTWLDYPEGTCDYPPKDTGKACYQNSDCEVSCIVTTGEPWPYSKDSVGYFKGQCGVYSVLTCYPEIPLKTKNQEDLRTNSCV